MRVYLAGPEVFLADRDAIAAEKKAICAQQGLIGVFPTDPAPAAPQAATDWMRIYLGNEAHIQGCDALIANLTPFRGASADLGTAYELGFMRALGRPVLIYSNTPGNCAICNQGHLRDAAHRRASGAWEDADGMEVEDFGLTDNLRNPRPNLLPLRLSSIPCFFSASAIQALGVAPKRQKSFSNASLDPYHKQSRREHFLADMEIVVSWAALPALIGPHYP
jgi:nucleoside 2-deoxyribosyltransferase